MIVVVVATATAASTKVVRSAAIIVVSVVVVEVSAGVSVGVALSNAINTAFNSIRGFCSGRLLFLGENMGVVVSASCREKCFRYHVFQLSIWKLSIWQQSIIRSSPSPVIIIPLLLITLHYILYRTVNRGLFKLQKFNYLGQGLRSSHRSPDCCTTFKSRPARQHRSTMGAYKYLEGKFILFNALICILSQCDC